MAEAKLYGQNKGGMSINGIIKDYYAYAGENISAGDLVEYVNGVADKTDYGESVDTQLSTETYTGYLISAIALDENRVFIAHSYTSDYYLYGIVVTVNGASIEKGTDTQLSSTTYSGNRISAVTLDENRVFIAHSTATTSNASNYLYGMICSVDGATIKVETDTKLSDSSYGGRSISAKLISMNTVFIAHNYGGNYYLYGLVCTISGTTITAGTDTKLVGSSDAGQTISVCPLSNGNVFIAHSRTSNYYLYGIVVSIEGTTITAGSDTGLNSTQAKTGARISTCLVANGNVFIAHSYRDEYELYGMIVSIEGTTIAAGSDTGLNNSSNTAKGIDTCLLPNGNVLVLHNENINYNYLRGMVVSIDGITLTRGTDIELNDAQYTGNEMSSLLLSNGTIFIVHSHTKNSYYLYAQIFGIDYDNNIPTNHIIATEMETQVRKVTTGQFDGVAKTSGTGGDETGHNDVVRIWTKVKDIIPEGTQQVAMADGKQLCDANGDIFLVREASA